MAKKMTFEFDEDFLQLLSKAWQKFFKRFNEIETLPVSEWKHLHLVAYLAKRYKEHYKKNFSFSVKGAPSKSTEIYMMKRMIATLGTTNNKVIKAYIDWVFDKKIIPLNKKIRSIGFFANTSYANEFKIHWADSQKIKRSTSLPQEYLKVATDLDVPVATFGDLAFAKQALDANPDSEDIVIYKKLFHELYRYGFEFEMLKDLR